MGDALRELRTHDDSVSVLFTPSGNHNCDLTTTRRDARRHTMTATNGKSCSVQQDASVMPHDIFAEIRRGVRLRSTSERPRAVARPDECSLEPSRGDIMGILKRRLAFLDTSEESDTDTEDITSVDAVGW